MIYERLADFIQNRMRMSHVYQPVMLMALLRGGGRRSTTEIARSILAHDESQVEYYEKVTNNMVGRVLRNNGIVQKEGGEYYLVGYEELDGEQVERLVELCRAKLDELELPVDQARRLRRGGETTAACSLACRLGGGIAAAMLWNWRGEAETWNASVGRVRGSGPLSVRWPSRVSWAPP
jgi:hypothetical protein